MVNQVRIKNAGLVYTHCQNFCRGKAKLTPDDQTEQHIPARPQISSTLAVSWRLPRALEIALMSTAGRYCIPGT
jgi:hypothetical protein